MHETHFEGIVIGYENQGDANRLISFYTPHFGKLEIVAKGVRYEKSKLKGHLELLTHGEFISAQNKGRGVLTDATTLSDYSCIRDYPETAYFAYAVAEMFDTYLFPHAPDPVHWDLLCRILRYLNVGLKRPTNELSGALRGFAKIFLQGLGYLDDMHNAASVEIPKILNSRGGASMIRERSTVPFFGSMRGYDELLTHTDIAGPTFSNIERRLRQLAR